MEARAFSPGHVTCFFSAHNDPRLPPQRRGSRGVGFCLESGVEAHAIAHGSSGQGGNGLPFELEVWDNGRRVAEPRTTRATLEALVASAEAGAPVARRLEVRNRYALPLGAGFGVSGACALSAALAANCALGLDLPFGRCVEAAHVGEVSAASGLGDVVAQAAGGFEARLVEGLPPSGSLRALGAPTVPLALVSFGPLRTREFLGAPERVAAANRAGADAMERFLAAPTLGSAMAQGLEFARRLGLVSPRAGRLLGALPEGCQATVAMLGDSLVVARPPTGFDQAARQGGAGFVAGTRLSARGAQLLGPGGAHAAADQE